MIRFRRCFAATFSILSAALISCEKQEEAIIPVSSIIVSPHSMRLTEGDEEKLDASVFPENATDKSIIWHTSDKTVVLVEDGSVIAMAPGEADVEASAGGKYDKCHITVTPRHIPVESVTLDWSAITLTEDESTVLTATIHPDNASDKSVSWSSSNPGIASVIEGRIVAEKAGQAVITVTATDGNKTAECTVSVLERIISVVSVSLDQTSATLTEGETLQLTATVSPDNASNKNVTWYSTNPEIASVDDKGFVSAISAGEVTIRVITQDGEKTAECYIIVKERIYEVASVSLDKANATLTEGETIQLTATVLPDNATNKKVTWSSDSQTVATVSQDGLVTAVSPGEATIKVITEDGGKEANCRISVLKRIIYVTEVSIIPASVTITAGESVHLSAIISPDDATDKGVDWLCYEPEYASIDENGLLTAIVPARTTVRATSRGSLSWVYAECPITILPATVPVESVAIQPSSLSMTEGESKQLAATVLPSDATDKGVTWSSDNQAVASVSQDGLVTAVSEGSAKIQVTTNDGQKTAECSVIVNHKYIPVSSITLEPTSTAIAVGNTASLQATVYPANADDPVVTWESSDNSVVTVDQNGRISGISEGTAAITASAGGKSATCSVEVAIPLRALILNKTEVELYIGEVFDLKYTKEPANATAQFFRSTSSNERVARISWTDQISALSEGEATITHTAITPLGEVSAYCHVIVRTPVSSISLSQSSATLVEGETLSLVATVLPDNAYDKSVSWGSSNPSVVTVNSSGKVTAIKEGNATITAMAGKYSAECTVDVQARVYPVTAVSLDRASATLTEGETLQLTATVSPDNATNKTVSWTSMNSSIATVSDGGLITAIAPGSATIRVTTADGGKTAECTVNVKARVIAVSSISLNQTNGRIPVGGTLELSATVLPSNATNKTVIWTTSAPSVATVEQNGVTTGVAVGTTTIQATTQDGGKIARCNIEVFIPATSISITNPNGYSYINVGEQLQLNVEILPEDTTYKTVTWTSREPEIASVDSNGLVTAIKKGSSVITAEIDGLTAYFTIHCKDSMPGGFEGIYEEEW